MKPTAEFLEHACGNAGINGGNPAAPLWFCGIEFGQRNEREPALDHVMGRPHSPAGLPHWTPEYLDGIAVRDAVSSRAESWPFMQKMARVAMAYDETPAASLSEVQSYVRERLLRPDGGTFQMNLYPLPFNNASEAEFKEGHQKLTGFPNKTMYRAWCMEHRFPRLRELFERHKPRVLICVGTSYEAEFRLAFLGDERVFEEPAQEIDLTPELASEAGRSRAGSKRIRIYPANDGASVLAITPFLGQGGLMATAHLHETGRILRSLASPAV